MRGLLDDGGKPECPEGRMGCTHTPGARVFDRVSGQEGTVVSATVETVLVSAPERSDG